MSSLPKLALVGRPNVGKSALFNRICGKRIAIVDEEEGITRDRLYATAELFGFNFEVIDTGGIDPRSNDSFRDSIKLQALIALEEADSIILVVDGLVGPTELDLELARLLLKKNKPLTLAVNKIDNDSLESSLYLFYSLGIKQIVGVSALQGHHIVELLDSAWKGFDKKDVPEQEQRTKIAVVGRPNVGKSTLINALLEEERCIVSPLAGTTRDSVDIPLSYDEHKLTLIDTAGIRRKQKEKAVVEKFASLRTQRSIERADICLLVIDAQEGMTNQDNRVLKMIEEAGKGCIILLNKWDVVQGHRMEHTLQALKKESPFLAHTPIIIGSAYKKRNLDKIFPALLSVREAGQQKIATHQLNTFIQKAMQIYHPPMIQGKRLRIYYLTQVGVTPPKFMLFLNHSNLLTDSYKKYLMNRFRENFSFTGMPIVWETKDKSPQGSPKSRTT